MTAMNEPTPSVQDLVAQVNALQQRLALLERRRTVRARWLVASALVIASVAWGQLTVFAQDTPAIASQVNGNFNQLKSKVGPVTTQQVTLTGDTQLVAGSSGRAALASANVAFGVPIIEVQHTNQTQGVGLGWASVFATGSSADVSLTLSPKGNGRVIVNELVANTESAFELSCGEASYLSSLQGTPFCCRINVRDGAVTCTLASNANGGAWGGGTFVYPGMTATTAGRYHLSCVAGAPGANFPFCCRINANTGSTVCGQGNSYGLGSSGNATVF
jgi:hypothetical protein